MAAAASRPVDVLVSVPGSIMLSGEHAVLCGSPALVGAVSQSVSVRLCARSDDRIVLCSALGTVEVPIARLAMERPFQFAGAAIQAAAGPSLLQGFDLSIDAAMPDNVGLGSSAAVVVAVYAAVHVYVHGFVPGRHVLWRACRDVIRSVQGRGSGADAAASVYGGILLYAQDEGVLEQYSGPLPAISLFYVGYKTPTPAVIAIVDKHRSESPAVFAGLDARMERATRAAAVALRQGDVVGFGAALQEAQAVLAAYGVCDANIESLVRALLEQDGVQAAKISGSGLGDCVLAVGMVTQPERIPFRQIPVTIDTQGISVEIK
ncbi:MAG: mevalonate kinase [Kiritimatiellia bacterium]